MNTLAGLSRLTYYDELNEQTYSFLTDAEYTTVISTPEVEWYAVKQVLINLGYTVIEINETEN